MGVNVLIHIITGSTAFITSAYILYKSMTIKYTHMLMGWAFTVMTVMSAITGGVLSFGKSYEFLVLMAALTIWQVVLGVGFAVYKNAFMSWSAGLSILMLPIIGLLIAGNTSVEKSIGGIYLAIVLYQLYLYFRKANLTSNEWLTQHIGMMIGAVVSMCTALLLRLLDESYDMSLVIWLLPTIILTPLAYKLRFYPRKRNLK